MSGTDRSVRDADAAQRTPAIPDRPAHPGIRRFLALVAVAVPATLSAVALRTTELRTGPILDAAVFGTAILAAGFLLSWRAETAEQRISQGLILAAVALITVLPEYAVDIYYAFTAGVAGPDSPYVHYAAANTTGPTGCWSAWPGS